MQALLALLTKHSLGSANSETSFSSGIQREKQLSVQKTQKATLGSKANRTEMVATAQHKATSTIRIAEEEKSVQNLRSSATYLTLIVKVDA